MSNLKFKCVTKDKLFYNAYEYSIRFALQELSCIRHLDHDLINDIIQARKKWRGSHTMRRLKFSREIDDNVVLQLHNMLDEILAIKSDYKLVIGHDTGYIYSNDLEVLEHFNQLSYLKNKKLNKVLVDRPLNTIKLKNPTYKHRSYFRCLKLDQKDREAIKSFLTVQKTEVRISPALTKYFLESHRLTLDHYFIDYNDSGIIVMLSLIKPNLVRKTLDIISA